MVAPDGYRNRVIDKKVSDYLEIFGAVSIEGPKNCGKTWTARAFSESEFQLNHRNKKIAEIDVNIALKGEEPHLIDEWQEVPEIWDEVRFEVDRSTKKGRFILCASSTLATGVKNHSGAGRIGVLKMRPMSLYESGDSDGSVSLEGLFNGSFQPSLENEIRLEDLVKLTVRGGWPDQIGLSEKQALVKNKNYLDRLCEDDVVRIDGVKRDSRKMKMLLRSLARNESSVVSDSRIMADMGINDNETMSSPTLNDYLGVLRRLNILCEQEAFSANVRSSVSVGKSPKRHLVDPSLSIAALNMDVKSCIRDLETYGFMFEAMCERDLDIYSQAIGGNLYHYRDNKGNEIDAVITIPGREWGAFEIKLGTNQIDSAASKLIGLSAQFEEPPRFLCVICGMSNAAYRRPDGVYVVPITMLGP
ncbi:putative ATPase (AAA+ superfamily) [Thermoplasmatales archaeon BRNA1]|nr:putative ATPase (AAA+ superfamily) [Thermoplasmatales archaeon BRNA1]